MTKIILCYFNYINCARCERNFEIIMEVVKKKKK